MAEGVAADAATRYLSSRRRTFGLHTTSDQGTRLRAGDGHAECGEHTRRGAAQGAWRSGRGAGGRRGGQSADPAAAAGDVRAAGAPGRAGAADADGGGAPNGVGGPGDGVEDAA